ncbi:MAG: GAF domain-containing protein [Chloroflexi bacterium]|nr:MAG: GAF domain-containing protein [Chloroflexota bacterium]
MTVNNLPTGTDFSHRVLFVRWLEKISLRVKLIIGFVTIAAFTTFGVGFSINRTVEIELTRSVSANLNGQARSLALTAGNELAKQVELLKTLELDAALQKNTADANARYQGDRVSIQAGIAQKEQQWLAAGNNDIPLVKDVISNETAQALKLFRLLYNDHAQILITDKYGALIAATHRPSHYNQAIEDWWQAAYNSGEGSTYISTPVFDESSRTYACDIAMPVRGNDAKLIGVLRSTFRISALAQSIASARTGETSFASLLFPNNELIDAGGARFTIDAETRDKVMTTSEETSQFVFNGRERLVTEAPLSTLSTEKSTIRNLNWILVVDQDPAEIMRPVAAAAQTALYIGLGTLLIASLLGLAATQYLAAPITRLTAVARKVRAGDLQARARVEAQDEIGTLAESFNAMTGQLEQTLENLELRVAERTTELEHRQNELSDRTVQLELTNIRMQKRAAQLQAISEVVRTVASIRSLPELLPRIAKVISEKFGFYHVGIFLLDEARQYAILSATNSEGGQRMLSRGHRLKVGAQGIVGYVTDTGNPRIALDTGADAAFFNNPDLPSTHSEMAAPLKSGSKVIGALDVQSEQTNAFTREDIDVIETLADQLSIAIENARLFDNAQKSLNEVETIYRQYVQREWSRVAVEEKLYGFRYTVAGAAPLDKPVDSARIKQVSETGKLILDSNEKNEHATLAIPIKLRDETIGIVNIRTQGKRSWNDDEVNLVQAVADRVAISAENARLLQESQLRAEKERAIGKISEKLSSTVNLENVFRTALQELGQIVPGSEIFVEFEQGEDAQ